MGKRLDWEKANKRSRGAATSAEEIAPASREITRKGKVRLIPADEICDRNPHDKDVTFVIKGRNIAKATAKPANTSHELKQLPLKELRRSVALLKEQRNLLEHERAKEVEHINNALVQLNAKRVRLHHEHQQKIANLKRKIDIIEHVIKTHR